MTNTHELHNKAFSSVSAFVVCKDNERVATIAFKFPKDDAGRLWCYFHFIGEPMVRAYAGGYGYDKKSAAVESAVEKLPDNEFKAALSNIGGNTWDRALREAGFTVLQAV